MINNMKGKTYAERLNCLKIWILQERRNRQDLIEVFRMCNELSRLKLNDLFTLDENIRGTRDILRNLLNFGVHETAASIFSPIRVINRRNQLDQRTVGASSINAFKRCVSKNKGNKDGLLHGLIRQALRLPGGFSGR